MIAVTSIAPGRRDDQIRAISSWKEAGCEVVAVQSPREVRALQRIYGQVVRLVPVVCERRPRVGQLIERAAASEHDVVLLINSDIELYRVTPDELRRYAAEAGEGVAYFVRHDHSGGYADMKPQYPGIDAYLFRRSWGRLWPQDAAYSLGCCFWDFLLPWLALEHQRPLRSLEHPVARHRAHEARWSTADWLRDAVEFARLTGYPPPGRGVEPTHHYVTMSQQVRGRIARESVPVLPVSAG